MKQERADAVVKIDPLIPASIERPDDAFAKALIERTGLNRYRAIMQKSSFAVCVNEAALASHPVSATV